MDVGKKIKKLSSEGYKKKQAVAIALSMADKKARRKRRKN
jgi:hypothetical protein